jgi:predicted dehydrogenase
MRKVKLGIIGIGNMGSTHASNIVRGLCPEIELTCVADRKEERRLWANKSLGDNVHIYNEGSDLIRSGDCEAVIVSVPHYQHPTLAIDAFNHNLHVMCEKPAGVYTKAVKEMNETARKSGKTFGMMFNQRTNCLYKKMHEIVSSGEMGNLIRVTWIITDWFRSQCYYDSGSWRATWDGEGGGVLLNQCPHNLDLLQWICGMPESVHAFLHYGKWHNIEVEDDVTAYLEYPGGATGVFITTTGEAPGTNRLEISLDKGKLVCENDKLMLYRLDQSVSDSIRTCTTGFGHPECTVEEVKTDGSNPQHIGVLNAFAANILRGEPLVAEGYEGINGLTLSNAMHLSSWLNKKVSIPFDEDLFLSELNKRRETSKAKSVTEKTFDTSTSYNGAK